MVFSGLLLKPGGEAPVEPGAAVRHLAVLGRGRRARRRCAASSTGGTSCAAARRACIPPEAVVAEPLRRLFVLQFGVLVGGLIVYWLFDSSVAGLAVLLVAKTAADLVLAVLERLRAARIKAAVEAGIAAERQTRGHALRRRAAGASAAR